MATAPKPGTSFQDYGAMMAIGSVGNAINARENTKSAQKMNQLRLDQLRQKIAFDEATRRRQMELMAQETERQQMMARAGGDTFADSLGLFQAPAEAGIGDASSQIAELYRQYMSRPAPAMVAPAATGPAAQQEAAMRAEATADVEGQRDRLAAVQGFDQYMDNNSRSMGQNETLAALINNFSRGSAGVSNAAVQAEAGQFVPLRAVEPNKSSLGDMFTGLATIGYLGYADQQRQPANPYGIQPGDYQLNPTGNNFGQGVRPPAAGGDYGIKLPSDLGIGSRR
jgi:hypothetical protein